MGALLWPLKTQPTFQALDFVEHLEDFANDQFCLGIHSGNQPENASWLLYQDLDPNPLPGPAFITKAQ